MGIVPDSPSVTCGTDLPGVKTPPGSDQLQQVDCKACGGIGEFWVTPSISTPCPAQCDGGYEPGGDA